LRKTQRPVKSGYYAITIKFVNRVARSAVAFLGDAARETILFEIKVLCPARASRQAVASRARNHGLACQPGSDD
jgi:hypothetical protein